MALKVTNSPAPTTKLKVVNTAPAPPLKVVSNTGGMQYTAPSPQQTAPVKYVQNAVPQQPLQSAPVAQSLQGGNSAAVQNAATVAQIAEAQRVAVAQEVARQKELKRAGFQSTVDARIAANQSSLKLSVQAINDQRRVVVGRNYAPAKISVPKYENNTNADVLDPEFEKIKEDAKRQAMKLVDGLKEDPNRGGFGFGRFVDKVTFGSDRRKSNARKWAEEQANAVADRQVKVYEGKLDAHNKLQAQLQADYEAKKLVLGATELNALADAYNKKIQDSINDLKRVEAYTIGTVEGYGLKAEEKITSKAVGAASFINRNVVKKIGDSPVWKYTLGGGSENIPSIVTAPSRAINFIGNINTNTRDVYQYGGTQVKRTETGKNAWQSTFDQRNFNIRPVVDKPYDKATAYKELQTGKNLGGGVNSTLYWQKFKKANSDQEKEEIAKKYWEEKNKAARGANSLQELAADPLNFIAGAGAVVKGAKGSEVVSKLDDVARAGKYTGKIIRGVEKVAEVKNMLKAKAAENKIISWLGAEYKTPEQKLADAIKVAKEAQGTAINTLMPRLKAIDSELLTKKFDFTIFDDLANLTDSEAKMFQRMKGNKLTASDRLKLAGKNFQPIREKLEALSKKYDAGFTARTAEADRITKEGSQFLKRNKTYSPATAWTEGDRTKYNFRKRSKGRIQSKADLEQGVVDRYLNSDLRHNMKRGADALKSEREAIVKKYTTSVDTARANVKKYDAAVKSPVNKVRKVVSAPTRLWKKAVLKYRPAWTVNNVAYNAQAGTLVAGTEYVKEQTKMLRPSYARKAMDELPKGIRSDIASEFSGKRGKLDKFYNSVENNSRVAAYRALKKKGFSDADALKRVDKYFFNNKIRNVERPLKAVAPFYSFQKNLVKAGVNLPFDRPVAAIAYNRLERHQKQTFEKDFAEAVPKLKEYGYSDDEIIKIRDEQAKKYAKRLKIGGKYYNTPFNAFSDKSLGEFGLNPYIAAISEAGDSVDSFGAKISGKEASFTRRLISKFPQAEIAKKKYDSWRVDKGYDKPSIKYIGASGSEGYGLTKEKQGYDSTKTNYVPSMDPRNKTKDDLTAFAGKPRGLTFDVPKLVEAKKLEKVTADYFAKSAEWKDMDFEKANAEREKLFAKYGMTQDDFFKGVLSKYDSESTKKIKAMKEDAAAKNKSLFEQYAAQPKGSKNIWATDKLKQLVADGYFNDNPFLKSFKWINKETVTKAQKQKAVQYALKTGDWAEYKKLYGKNKATYTVDGKYFKSAESMAKFVKSKDYKYASSTGDWAEYKKKYGTKETPTNAEGKHFKSAESMAKYESGVFWRKYAEASADDRKKMLAENPQYNTRSDWSAAKWASFKAEEKAKNVAKLRSWGKGSVIDNNIAENKAAASKYISKQIYSRRKKKVVYA